MVRQLRVFLTLPLALLFTLQFLIGSPAFAGITLCIEQDGCISLETKSEDCCAPLHTGGPEASLANHEAVCVSCIDVSLGNSDAGAQIASSNLLAGNLLGIPPRIERVLVPEGIPFVQSIGSPSGRTRLAAIRTIVLRV